MNDSKHLFLKAKVIVFRVLAAAGMLAVSIPVTAVRSMDATRCWICSSSHDFDVRL